MINGSDRILFIKIDDDYAPVACLTENSFNEDVEMLETTTRLTGGWKTSRPGVQSFNLDFTGIQFLNPTFSLEKITYDKLKEFKRNRELLQWRLSAPLGGYLEIFDGYISQLGESAVVDELLSFTGTITGYGKPITSNPLVMLGSSGLPGSTAILSSTLIQEI